MNNKVQEKVEENNINVEIGVKENEVVPMPTMSINMAPPKSEEPPVITNEKMIELYTKILAYMQEDREDANEAYRTFLDMVVNDGDASQGSKEAAVQLLTLRAKTSENMTRVMDLLMRVVLKERSTFPPYLTAHQENKVVISGKNRRNLIEQFLNKDKDKK